MVSIVILYYSNMGPPSYIRRLRVFEDRVLRRIFGPKGDEVTGNGENYIMRS
jgi:hypothetical protein